MDIWQKRYKLKKIVYKLEKKEINILSVIRREELQSIRSAGKMRDKKIIDILTWLHNYGTTKNVEEK